MSQINKNLIIYSIRIIISACVKIMSKSNSGVYLIVYNKNFRKRLA